MVFHLQTPINHAAVINDAQKQLVSCLTPKAFYGHVPCVFLVKCVLINWLSKFGYA